MIVINSLVILILLSVSIFLTYNYSQNMMKETIFNSAADSARYNAEITTMWISRVIDQVETIADMDAVKSMFWSMQRETLTRIAEREDYIETILVASIAGNYNSSLGGKGDITERKYFQEVLETREIIISKPFINTETNNRVIAIASPILSENNLLGVVAITVQLNYLEKLIQDMNLNGYGWIIDAEKNLLAHPKAEYIENSNAFYNRTQELSDITI